MYFFMKVVSILFLFHQIVFAAVTGVVYKDFNSNGLKEVGEVGVKDVTITAFDKDGNAVLETKSLNDGSYSLNLTEDKEYRIEFSDIPEGLVAGGAQGSSSSSVQFVSSNNVSNVDFSVISSDDYNPGKDKIAVAVPTFHPGASVDKTSLDNEYGIISFPYTLLVVQMAMRIRI